MASRAWKNESGVSIGVEEIQTQTIVQEIEGLGKPSDPERVGARAVGGNAGWQSLAKLAVLGIDQFAALKSMSGIPFVIFVFIDRGCFRKLTASGDVGAWHQ